MHHPSQIIHLSGMPRQVAAELHEEERLTPSLVLGRCFRHLLVQLFRTNLVESVFKHQKRDSDRVDDFLFRLLCLHEFQFTVPDVSVFGQNGTDEMTKVSA